MMLVMYSDEDCKGGSYVVLEGNNMLSTDMDCIVLGDVR